MINKVARHPENIFIITSNINLYDLLRPRYFIKIYEYASHSLPLTYSPSKIFRNEAHLKA